LIKYNFGLTIEKRIDMGRNTSNLLVLAVAILGIQFSAGAQTPLIRYGDRMFHQFNFSEALEIYKSAMRKDTGSIYLKTRIADCYRLMGDPVNSEPYYAVLAKSNAANPINKYYYGQALRSNMKYLQAADAFQTYIEYTGHPSGGVQECIDGIKKVGKLAKDNGLYALENALTINSDKSDFAPSFFVNKSVMFSSNRSLHQAVMKEDEWSGAGFLRAFTTASLYTRVYMTPEIIRARGFNETYHEGPASYDKVTHELYITRSNVARKKLETVRTKIYKVTCDTATGKFTSDIVEAVPFNSNDYSVMHPTISEDGSTMFFASDMPDREAQGGMDLYVSVRDKSGHWGAAKNLGTDINTMGDEMFPFIASDSALYFASNGHEGLGGLDIYRSYLLPGGQWSMPKNLGFPINTNYDDFGYIIDDKGTDGRMVSNRPGGKGSDDIYSFVRKEISVVGQVLDQASLQPVDDVNIYLKEDGAQDFTSDKTDRSGGFCFSVKPHTQYTLRTSKLGYAARIVPVVTRQNTSRCVVYISKIGAVQLLVHIDDGVTKQPVSGATGLITDMQTGENARFLTDVSGLVFADIVLNHQYKIDLDKKNIDNNKYYLPETRIVSSESLINGDTLKVTMYVNQNTVNYVANLNKIYFDLDKWNIRPDAKAELNKVVQTLKENPNWKIQVSAHTDCRETDAYNVRLSQRRANSTMKYLVSKGIESYRLFPIGYGKAQPAVKCTCQEGQPSDCTEEQHQLNRRVEFIILNQDILSDASKN
jgi:outer membrane protein OmpA-like peptidoglycan-associated protein